MKKHGFSGPTRKEPPGRILIWTWQYGYVMVNGCLNICCFMTQLLTNDYGALKEAAFVQDSIGYRAITGSILQIGENINALLDEFVSNYAEIEWRRLVRMRNRIAHKYEDLEPWISVNGIWKVCRVDYFTCFIGGNQGKSNVIYTHKSVYLSMFSGITFFHRQTIRYRTRHITLVFVIMQRHRPLAVNAQRSGATSNVEGHYFI